MLRYVNKHQSRKPTLVPIFIEGCFRHSQFDPSLPLPKPCQHSQHEIFLPTPKPFTIPALESLDTLSEKISSKLL